MALRISEAVLSGVNTWRDYELHKAREKLEVENHNIEMQMMKDHHLKEENLAKQIYLVEKFTEIEQHFQQLNADLLTVSKESERDMFDQRNQQFSTILVATTIVLSGLITVLIQGVLQPDDGSSSNNVLVIIFAFSNSGSMALLFICSVLCLEIIWRASQFMYKRSKIHTYDLGNAIKKTKDMMRKVRGIKAYEMASLERPRSRRHISGMTDKEILEEFAQHENEVQTYLQERQKIIDKAAYMVFSDDGSSVDSESFSHFWRDSCSYYSSAAILFFYAGSALLFVATMTYMWARFHYTLSSPLAANVSVVLITLALVASFGLVLYLRYYDKRYLESKEKFEEDNRKAEIRLNKAEERMARSEPLEIPLSFEAPSSQEVSVSEAQPTQSVGGEDVHVNARTGGNIDHIPDQGDVHGSGSGSEMKEQSRDEFKDTEYEEDDEVKDEEDDVYRNSSHSSRSSTSNTNSNSTYSSSHNNSNDNINGNQLQRSTNGVSTDPLSEQHNSRAGTFARRILRSASSNREVTNGSNSLFTITEGFES